MLSLSQETARKGWADAVEKVNRSKAVNALPEKQQISAPSNSGWANAVSKTNARRKGHQQ